MSAGGGAGPRARLQRCLVLPVASPVRRDDGTGHEAAEGLETENMALKKRLAEQVFGDDLFPHHQGPPCADFFDGCAAHPGLCDNMSQRTGGG